MESILLTFFTSIAVVLAITPSIISISKHKNIFDFPGENKLHKGSIPHIGGIAIFAGILFSYSLWKPPLPDMSFRYVLASLIVLFLIGLKDDILGMTPLKKLGAQLLVAMIVVMDGEGAVRLSGLHGIFNVFGIPMWMCIILSIFTFVTITNSFNLIDGIDGLAAGLGLIASLTFGFWFFCTNNLVLACMSFALSGAVLGILFFNFSPAKIFIGDCGSLIIGFVLSMLAVKFIELNQEFALQHLSYSSTTDSSGAVAIVKDTRYQRFIINGGPGFAVAVLIVPLYDTLRSFLVRIINRKSPFKGDTNHIHHRLLFLGFNPAEICIILFLVNILFITVAYLLRDVSPDQLIGIIFLSAISLDFILFLIKRSKTSKMGKA